MKALTRHSEVEAEFELHQPPFPILLSADKHRWPDLPACLFSVVCLGRAHGCHVSYYMVHVQRRQPVMISMQSSVEVISLRGAGAGREWVMVQREV